MDSKATFVCLGALRLIIEDIKKKLPGSLRNGYPLMFPSFSYSGGWTLGDSRHPRGTPECSCISLWSYMRSLKVGQHKTLFMSTPFCMEMRRLMICVTKVSCFLESVKRRYSTKESFLVTIAPIVALTTPNLWVGRSLVCSDLISDFLSHSSSVDQLRYIFSDAVLGALQLLSVVFHRLPRGSERENGPGYWVSDRSCSIHGEWSLSTVFTLSPSFFFDLKMMSR